MIVIKRDYLVYPRSQGSIFCSLCKLFGGTSQFGTCGFNYWKHASQQVTEHENSLYIEITDSCRVNRHLISQLKEEVKYWRCVLQRVVTVVKKLSSRGLAFRGKD
ncbi:hypothetical protein PR048_015259 [Dryococelus australis]|uniref:Uncharacterized protein n=1 Tax=Dryococelus australis TaxID=614101 RepID=A0ABQ9HGY8_9NEOP|nr:hypothetical protein PR048_015259 [Dryococelus australis]